MALDGLQEASDETLLVLYANGDRGAAQVLTQRLLPRILAHAYRLLSDRHEAEDVAQEAMLRLWKVAPDWRQGEAQVSTWLYRVVANLCTDRFRRKGAEPLDGVAEPMDPSHSAAEQMTNAQRAEALQVALAELPDRQRQAVVLRHIEGLANPQIAEIMEISTEAVESLTARGKRALTAILAGKRDELGYDE